MGDDLVSDIIDAVEERVQNLIEKLTPKNKKYAPRLSFAASKVATGFDVLKIQGPPKGYFWYIRQVRAGGINNPLLVADGSCLIYVGSEDMTGIGSSLALTSSQWRDILADGTTRVMPQAKGYSNGEFRVGPQESVYFIFIGQAPGENIVCSLDAALFPDSDENIEWVI